MAPGLKVIGMCEAPVETVVLAPELPALFAGQERSRFPVSHWTPAPGGAGAAAAKTMEGPLAQ